MGIIKRLMGLFVKSTESEKNSKKSVAETPSFCWGYQQYDRKVRNLQKDKQIEVNNHRMNYMKWKGYVVEHIDGIRLKGGKIETCPECGENES